MTVCLKPQVHANGVDNVSSYDIPSTVLFTETNCLMLFKGIIAIYCANNIEYINTLYSYDVMLQHSLQPLCLLMCFKWFTFVDNFDHLNVRMCCIYCM